MNKAELIQALIRANEDHIKTNNQFIHALNGAAILHDYLHQILTEAAMQEEDNEFAMWIVNTVTAAYNDYRKHREKSP